MPSLHGLTHIALAVRDLDRTVLFYTRAFARMTKLTC